MDCLCIVTTKVRRVREDGNECEREEAFLSFQMCVRVGCYLCRIAFKRDFLISFWNSMFIGSSVVLQCRSSVALYQD